MKYKCTITFEEPILGTAPTNQQVYTDFIVQKAIDAGVNGIEDEWDTAPAASALPPHVLRGQGTAKRRGGLAQQRTP